VEPFEYLRLLRRRWRLLAACVVIAATAAWITAPGDDPDALVRYEADATIVRDPTAEAPVAIATVQLFMRTGEVPRRVAAEVGYDGNPLVLARSLDFEADETVGTLAITAQGDSPDAAAELANTAVEETLAYMGERAREEQQEAIDEANAEVATLEAEIDELQRQIAGAEAAGQPTDLLETERDAKLTSYGSALTDQATLADQPAPSAGYQILEPAAAELASPVDEGLSAPRSRPARAGLGIVFGLLLGAGIILVVERVDPRLYTREQVEEAFGLPVVAEIPDAHPQGGDYAIATVTEPASALTEAYRSLRASLLLMPTLVVTGGGARPRTDAPDGEPAVVLVTSPEPSDGKTTTVANLAAGFAEAGRNVLVLGCDFRRPEIHKHFGLDSEPGLADVLTGHERDLLDVVQPTDIPGVRLAASGRQLANLGDVASLGRQVVTRARSHADVVLIDTAPLLATTEATELIPAADSVVVVCRAGKTTQEAARRTVDLLARLGAPVVGVALVGARTAESAYSHYYTAEPAPRGKRRRRQRA
jgi:capsular exopolysaccharide synthesis family protein